MAIVNVIIFEFVVLLKLYLYLINIFFNFVVLIRLLLWVKVNCFKWVLIIVGWVLIIWLELVVE